MCRVDDACPDSLKCDTGLVAVTNVTEVTVHGKCFAGGLCQIAQLAASTDSPPELGLKLKPRDDPNLKML